MTTPQWADPQLSADLAVLRARGEGQALEYMQEFPFQARELGKEIAAFATSNAGIILLGVADNGDLVGLRGVDSSKERDELLRRLEGICRGTIKPSITPSVAFAVDGDNVVLVISVPQGTQPVYYANSIPYVRHISESRPAEPHEVVDLVRLSQSFAVDTLQDPLEDAATARARRLASALAGALHDVLIFADQLEDRSVNPHLQDLRSQIAYAGEAARATAATDDAEAEGIVERLTAFSDAAERVANYRMAMGRQSWMEFTALVDNVKQLARDLDTDIVQPLTWPGESRLWASQRFRELYRELAALVERSERAYHDGRIDELQQGIAARGLELERIAYMGHLGLDVDATARLKELGRRLHLIETFRLYMDGGVSWRAMLDESRASVNELNAIVIEITGADR